MLVTMLSSLFGIFSSAIPDILKLFKDSQDRKHELKILEMQIDQQARGQLNRLEEIKTNADISESKALYKTYNTGIKWVDALNGTVRPVISYSFFAIYSSIKVMQFVAGQYDALWTEEDQAIFSGIVSFYFGQRAMAKLRCSK